MADPYPGLREWAAVHAASGYVQARQVLELIATLPEPVELPPCKTPGHYADCDCRWAATGEGGC